MKPAPTPPPRLLSLANGVRLIVQPAPHLHTASASVFVRAGSAHERRADNGIAHVIEHMVFKGTATRDAARINRDAERLGAEANAHTDKDHTAYHLRGRVEDAPRFVRLLADLVGRPVFPADELERERQVLLQEMAEVEDDPMSLAYQLFDRGCYGLHPAAQPVIGTRGNLERFTRDELVRWVARHYTGRNLVVALTGPFDAAAADALAGEVERGFGGLPAGEPNLWPVPEWQGGARARRLSGGGQAHLVLGFPVPSLADDDPASEMAALLFGEGMSSPLMAELRERRGLAYYAACAADRFAACGQLAIEVSTAPDSLDEVLGELMRLLQVQAEGVARADLVRARRQMAVRLLRERESATRSLEAAALDLLVRGAVRDPAERLAQAEAVTAGTLRDRFQAMLAAGASLGLAGSLPSGAGERAREAIGARG